MITPFSKNQKRDYVHLVNQTSRIVFDTFDLIEPNTPTQRYLLYSPLLSLPQQNLWPFPPNRTALDQEIDGESVQILRRNANALDHILNSVGMDITYLVVNYKSALHGERHSVVLRKGGTPKEKVKVAYAILFYILTFAGYSNNQHPKLRQLIHYILLDASHKPALILCFDPRFLPCRTPTNSDPLLHIGASRNCVLMPGKRWEFLLDELGFNDIIAELVDGEKDLYNTLAALLTGEGFSLWECVPRSVQEITESIVENFPAFVEDKLDRGAKDSLQALAEHLNNLFPQGKSQHNGKPFDRDQTCFTLSTSLLWREACPTDVTYVFPVQHANATSLLTVGTRGESIWDNDRWTFMAWLAQTLFIHPLTRDFAQLKQSHERTQTRINVIRELQERSVPRRLQPSRVAAVQEKMQLDVAALCEPEERLAGDFYNIVFSPRPPGDLWVIVGDVQGHGLDAAFVVTRLLAAYQQLIRHMGDPVVVAQELNSELYHELASGQFVTAFLLKLDKIGNRVSFTHAGHPAPLLCKPSQSSSDAIVADLNVDDEHTGFPLGVVEDGQYALSEFQFNPGEQLLLYTDGVVEAQNAQGKSFGKERLRNAVQEQ